MEIQALTVSQIIQSIKSLLEGDFSDVTVVGEISNLSHSSAGHYYFTLSDSNSSISCALFKMDAFKNPSIKRMKDGDKVLVRGPISVYGRRGTFQLITKKIIPYGKGDLKAQFEFLKNKLTSRGYFDLEHKEALPEFPKKIAVITAKNGAAVRDFINVIERRSIWHDITVIPAIVQGDNCASSVIRAIDKVMKKDDFDVLVITRGGGSIEDLWGFNDEQLIEKVFELTIPVISAIGHQTDFTLLDYVSDYRAETPSAAAEVLSQKHTELKGRMESTSQRLKLQLERLKNSVEERLVRVSPDKMLLALKDQLHQARTQLGKIDIARLNRALDFTDEKMYLDELLQRSQVQMKRALEKSEQRTELSGKVIETLDPKNVLGRGYSYIETSEGSVLGTKKDFSVLAKGSEFKINFVDGKAIAQKGK